jgi:hypothetical protein
MCAESYGPFSGERAGQWACGLAKEDPQSMEPMEDEQ